jgi:cation-transporting P-type ATPase F
VATVIVVGIFALGISRGESVVDMLVLSVAVAVGAVPEALPITLTVILALGVARIAARGGLVTKLDAAETLGSTTVILTDKTGTLTEGVMTLCGAPPAWYDTRCGAATRVYKCASGSRHARG